MKLHSFDVYDTLLTRCVAQPADLFPILGVQLRSAGLIADSERSFADRRLRAEAEARQTTSGGEIQFEDIYRELARAYHWDENQRQRAAQLELQLEAHLTKAVPEMRQLVQQARTGGGRVMFLSDMYLPKAFIAELLQREGFLANGDAVFVSGELKLAKHNGTLFKHLRTEYPEISEWQHTGDNLRADVEIPRRLGIRAAHANRCSLTHREQFVRGPERIAGSWRSAAAAAMRLARLAGDGPAGTSRAIWDSGVNVVGPLWFGFAEWCLDQALARGIKRLYFVARDGQIFHKVASAIAQRRNLAVDCRYLFGSRQAWHLPGLTQLDEAALSWIFNRQRYLTVEQVLKRVGLEPDDFSQELISTGFPAGAWTRDLAPPQTATLRGLLQTPRFQDAVRQRAETARQLAVGYLRQEGVLDGTPFALVDIGWHGNMQRSLGSLLRAGSTQRNQVLTGFYFGLQRRPADTELDQFVGYWPETGQAGASLRSLNVTILEMMAAADHGTVLGFRVEGDSIKPLLDGERNTAALAWGLELLQAGIVEFARAWLDFEPLQREQRTEFQALTREVLLRFIAAPSQPEAAAWSQFPHSGEQIERHKESIAPALSLWQSLVFAFNPARRPAGWWAEGSLVQRPNPALALYLLARNRRSGLGRTLGNPSS